ncbi:unnamed protein product [Larinioides sclopetarius]|uniref:Regulatory protein zeste n=1 Tax=Larinioides sclopetarius TaxID=280406 RepID=A0AAV1ZJ95_9ARAC
MIVTFMENHPDLSKGTLTNTFTQKCWSDIKQEVKRRYSEREQYRNGTGGGPPPKDLADLDLRVLALIGPDGYAGLKVMETAPISEIQGEKDSTCLDESFILETSEIEGASTPKVVGRENRRGLKRKRQRGMVIPSEKTESFVKAQEKTFEALKNKRK